ncbi:PTS transporter subunit IIC [Treponema pectinovorum]|uniref:PTS transporter subunit IIC n=1 Tax=Treponema pectinovorum TaxID=164 RepID=UPI003D944C48
MNKYVRRYLIDAMSGMAQGLFASLLIGTIIKTLGQQILKLGENTIASFLVEAGNFATDAHVVGAAMAVGIGYAMKEPALVLFSLACVGSAANICGGAGGPLAVLVVAVVAAELGNLVSKKTKVDIIVTPLVTILSGVLITFLTAKYIGMIASSFGNLIIWATTLRPFLMGMLISLIVGILLTLPVSSAAVCAALGLTGLAGGAAVAGCCAQMVGFAFLSFKENRWQGLLSQGLGTSMLQMPNIIKNPKIWLPACLTSLITGPLSTCFFKMEMNGASVSAGMGTCGLVGQIGVISGWYNPSKAAIEHGLTAIQPSVFNWLGLIFICFVLPAVLSLAFGFVFRKIGWIKDGDLALSK